MEIEYWEIILEKILKQKKNEKKNRNRPWQWILVYFDPCCSNFF